MLFTMLRSAKKVATRNFISRMLTTGHNYLVKHAEDSDNMKLATLFSETHDGHIGDVGEKNHNEHILGAIELLTNLNSAKDVFWNLYRNPKWSVNEISQDDALIGRMVVVPSADGEGVGYRLIERAVQHSHENSARRIFAHVGASNDGSRRALEEAGFEVVTSDKWMGNVVYLYGKKLSKVSEDIKYVVLPADASDNMKIASLIGTIFVNDAKIETDVTVDQEYYSILDKRMIPECYAFFVAKANQNMESTMLGVIELALKVNASEDVFVNRRCNPKWAISETSRKDAIIDKLVVVRSARGRGVGFSLIERAIQHAQENGVHRIFGLVGEFNVAIRGALEKAGFEFVSYDRWMINLEYVYGKQLKMEKLRKIAKVCLPNKQLLAASSLHSSTSPLNYIVRRATEEDFMMVTKLRAKELWNISNDEDIDAWCGALSLASKSDRPAAVYEDDLSPGPAGPNQTSSPEFAEHNWVNLIQNESISI